MRSFAPRRRPFAQRIPSRMKRQSFETVASTETCSTRAGPAAIASAGRVASGSASRLGRAFLHSRRLRRPRPANEPVSESVKHPHDKRTTSYPSRPAGQLRSQPKYVQLRQGAELKQTHANQSKAARRETKTSQAQGSRTNPSDAKGRHAQPSEAKRNQAKSSGADFSHARTCGEWPCEAKLSDVKPSETRRSQPEPNKAPRTPGHATRDQL